MTKASIKNIVFDFGTVLVDWNPKYLYRQFFSTDEEIENFLREIDFYQMNYQLDAGLTLSEFVRELSERFPKYQREIAAYRERWPETLGEANHPVVERLKSFRESSQLRIFGLTNWAAETFPHGQNKYEFFHWFEDVVVSGKEGVAKPEVRIYQILTERNHLQPNECLFIDDRQENVLAARELGWQAIHYLSAEQLEEELTQYAW